MSNSFGPLQELHLGIVTENRDPDSRGRLKVRLLVADMEVWAMAMTASAGQGYGISLLPKINETVVLAFISPDLPIVLGAVWAGSSNFPSQGEQVEDRYLLRSPNGTQVLIDDQAQKLVLETPNGYHLTIDDQARSVTLEQGGQKIEMKDSGITVTSSAIVEVKASQVKVSAGMVNVDSGMSKFSGVVKCDTLISNSVVSSSYTPGAGNIW